MSDTVDINVQHVIQFSPKEMKKHDFHWSYNRL